MSNNYRKIAKQVRSSFKKDSIKWYHVTAKALRWTSFTITPYFVILGISANMVTLFCAAIVATSLLLFGVGTHESFVIGTFLFLANSILDNVDGDICRYENSASYLGKFLDGSKDKAFVTFLPLTTAWALSSKNEAHGDFFMKVGALVTALEAFSLYIETRVSSFNRRIRLDGKQPSQAPKQSWLHRKMLGLMRLGLAYSSLALSISLPIALPFMSVFSNPHWLALMIYAPIISIRSTTRLILAADRANVSLRVHRISRSFQAPM